MRVAKWGNSLAVRLPAKVVKGLDLKAGDEVALRQIEGRTFGISKLGEREAAIERLRAFRGKLPADFKFNRKEANER